MSEAPGEARRGVTAVLAASAGVAVAYRVALGLGAEDADAFESSLAMSVARQLTDGPGGLYGPFGARNPLVLIHAPLFYRVAGLAAWPLARAGLGPFPASLAAGRSLSVLATAAALWMTARLARLDGAPVRTGVWAALVFAASPVLAGFPVAVRPDLLGVALQSAGVLLVLSALRAGKAGGAKVTAAFGAFGLAVCVKQHLVAAPLVSLGLLLAGRFRGRVGRGQTERGLALAAAVVAAVYGTEQVLTGGQVWQSAFVAASAVGRVHPAELSNALIVLASIAHRLVGPLALLLAAALVLLRTRPGPVRRLAWASGTLLLAATLALLLTQFVTTQPQYGAVLMSLEFAFLPLAIAAGSLLVPRAVSGNRLDAALWLYLVAEAALTTALCFGSTGAWVNYAIQAAVFASVLAARALSRALAAPGPRLALAPVGFALAAVAASAAHDVYDSARSRLYDRAALAEATRRLGRPAGEYFFVDLPGENRLRGRPELVFDHWLYPVFESLRLAEPRSGWLTRALTDGPVRVVVSRSPSPNVDGLPRSLPELGYRRAFRAGRFHVWQRARNPAVGGQRGLGGRAKTQRMWPLPGSEANRVGRSLPPAAKQTLWTSPITS